MRFLFILTLLLASAIGVGPVDAAGKHYALVVGVSTYRPGQPLPELPYTENDANDLAKVLTDGGYKVTLMTQTVGRIKGKEVLAPLSDFIRDQLDAMLTNPNLNGDDVVIVALAGHGVQYELVDGDKKTPKFYFCPTDAEISKVQTANDITAHNRVLDLAELYTAMNGCKAGGKLLLVDACRNDPTKSATTRSLASVTLPPLPPPPGGTAAFFSCSAHQQAFEDKHLRHGVFFHYVIEALKGDADAGTAKRPADGQITLAELSENVATTTYDYVRLKYNGAKQAPELKGEFRLTIPLISVVKTGVVATKPLPIPVTADEGKDAGELREFNPQLGLKLVWCPPGTFTMGTPDSKTDESPVEVNLTRGFWMGQTEVTQSQWQAIMKNAPWSGQKFLKEGPDFPATSILHADAVLFCQTLTDQERKASRLPTGWKYALPTEAQWEYACRAGTTTVFSSGDDESNLGEFAWHDQNSGGIGVKHAHEVRGKAANLWGLHDMHGNVLEWCADVYTAKLPGGENPSVTAGGLNRVFRGGAWDGGGRHCRSAVRYGGSPASRLPVMGFRVARVPNSK